MYPIITYLYKHVYGIRLNAPIALSREKDITDNLNIDEFVQQMGNAEAPRRVQFWNIHILIFIA